MFGPRGVLKCKASDKNDPTEQPRWGRIGKQTIEDSGPLTRGRMETIDDETSDAAVDYITRQVKAGKPFFCWMNTTRMHAFTHVKAAHRDKPGFTSRTYRAAVAYGVVAWFLTQLTTQVFPFFEIPNSAVRFVVIALAVGFPIAMLLSWLYEFTPAGIVRTEDVDPVQARSAQRATGRILDFITSAASRISCEMSSREASTGFEAFQSCGTAPAALLLG
jgi:hypothetical protein